MTKENWEIDLFNQYKAAQAAARFVKWVQSKPNVKQAEYVRRFSALPSQAQFALQQAVRENIDKNKSEAVGFNGRPMFQLID